MLTCTIIKSFDRKNKIFTKIFHLQNSVKKPARIDVYLFFLNIRSKNWQHFTQLSFQPGLPNKVL